MLGGLPFAPKPSKFKAPRIDAARLRELLRYDQKTGSFCRLNSVRGHFAGPISVKPTPEGYIVICVDGIRYQAHRLAWVYVHGCWPSTEIDHKNGDKADNRIENLRLATHIQNQANKPGSLSNQAGKKGVFPAPWAKGRRWCAQIKVNRKTYYLGSYRSVDDASAAYEAAARDLNGEFAWGAA